MTVARAGDIISRLIAGESKEEIILELEKLGATKRFETKDSKNTGLGFQVIYDKCVIDAEKADIGVKTRKPSTIILKEARKKFARWLRENNLAIKEPKKSGLIIPAPSFEYAKRFQEVLCYFGIESDIRENCDE